MAHTVVAIPELSVKYKDVFHLRNLYVMMHEMMWEEGWDGPEGDRWHADLETLYSEKNYQKAIHSGGKEYWFWWRVEKDIEGAGRGGGYFKWTLDIDFHLSYHKKLEVIHQGKKIKVDWGEVQIWFRPKLIGDKTGSWAKHKFMKHFMHTYEHRIMHTHIEKYEKQLWRDVYKMQSKIKDFLTMRTFIPSTAPPFHPKKFGHAEPGQ